MKLSRKKRKHNRSVDASRTKARNRGRKAKERQRRDARMVGELKAHELPAGPAVMSWLSRKLLKKATRITQEDVTMVLR